MGLLYSTGYSTQYSVMVYIGKESFREREREREREMFIYTYV